MPEYLAPGVYVEEIDTGSKPIEGVSTSTAGMIGVTERGPVNVPILITSFGEFRRWFGEFLLEADFVNGAGFHCFLPHAVDGFFTNGGKRLYVTRVLRDDADPASTELFDRGDVGSVVSALLRAADQGSGTAVNLPLLSVMAPGGLGAGDFIRIGDGSAAEYRLIAGTAASTHVPLTFPLSFAHTAPVVVTQFDRVVDPAFTGIFTLNTPASAGDNELDVAEVAAGDAAILDASGVGMLIEINTTGGANPAEDAEFRIITGVAGTGTTRTITLDADITRDYDGVDITPLTLLGGTNNVTNLVTDALPGDTVIFGDNLGGDFDDVLTLVHLNGAQQEVRRIGELQQLTLRRGAYENYLRNARVEQFQTVNDDRRIGAVAALPADTVTINGGDVTGLAPGLHVVLDPTGNIDPLIIRSVDETAGTVTFTTGLTFAHLNNTVLEPAAKLLTQDAAAGSLTLALDDRLGLSPGDVIRIVSGPEFEMATITALAGAAGAPPDAGAIVLSAPTRRAHLTGALVRRQVVSPISGDHHPAFLVLDARPGSTTLFVTDDDGFTTGDLVRVTTPGGQRFYHELSANAVAVAPAEVELTTPLVRNHALGAVVAQRDSLILVQAIDAGAWGDRLRISIEDEPGGMVTGARLLAFTTVNDLLLSSLSGVEVGTVLELAGPNLPDPPIGSLLKVQAIDRNTGHVTVNPGLDPDHLLAIGALPPGATLRVRSREFRLTVRLLRAPDPANPTRDEIVIDRELFINLSMDPRHSRYFLDVIGDINGTPRPSDFRPEGASWYIRTSDLAAAPADRELIRPGPETLVDLLPSGRIEPARHALTGGNDSIPLLSDVEYIGVNAADPEDRTGLQTLRNIDEISIVAAPGRTSPAMQAALITHCEELRYRFAVLDSPRQPNDTIADVRGLRQQYDTKYAAIYYPWLLVPHPFPVSITTPPVTFDIPPSGHVVGVYARTDIERGVHKAPANEVVRGIIGLRRALNKSEHDILNPYPTHINVIRDFRPNNRGIRIWGGRVITSDPDWKYVNVRRLLIFIEASLDRGLQWVVFEPNAEPLWARVRRTISNFLTVVWRNGALEGTKPEEAYFVKCDRTTMTQAEIDNGQLICVIGVAPVKPAEFVIIRIGLWTAHADT